MTNRSPSYLERDSGWFARRPVGWKLVPLVWALLALAACGRIDPQAEFGAARADFEAGDYQAADVRMSNVVQATPDDASAWAFKGKVALKLWVPDVAKQSFERATALGAQPSDVAEDLARALIDLGDGRKAVSVLEDADTAPLHDTADYWTALGRALTAANRLDDADGAFAKAVDLGASDVDYLLGRAELSMLRGETAAAGEAVGKAEQLAPNDADVLYARGMIALRSGHPADALEPLRKAADAYGAGAPNAREASVLSTLVQVALAADDVEGAGGFAARLSERLPDSGIAAYSEGLVAYRRGHFDDALAQLRNAARLEPSNTRVMTLLGATHLALGNLGQAEQELLKALAAAPADTSAIKLLAETRIRQRRPAAALDSLQSLTGDGGDDVQLVVLRGMAALESGAAKEAVAYFQQAVALDPANDAVKLQLARAYLAVGRDQDAIKLLGTSFGAAKEVDLAKTFMLLAAYVQSGDVARGRDRAAAIAAAPGVGAPVLTGVAAFYQLIGDRAAAVQRLQDAVKVDPKFVPAKLQLAGLLLKEGRGRQAEQYLNEVIAAEPGNVEALTTLAYIVAARGDLDQAERLLTAAVADPKSATARLALARLQMRRGRFDAAEKQIADAAEIKPDDPEVRLTKGLLALAQGRTKESVALLSSVSSAYPARADVSLGLAQAKLADQDVAGARRTLEKALEVLPGFWPLRAALGMVELRGGDADAALAIAKSLQADLPRQTAGYVLESEIRIAQRRYDVAEERLAAIYDIEPSWDLLARRALVLQLAGKASAAEPLLSAWLAKRPDDAKARLALASLLEGDGRKDEALDEYERLLAADQSNIAALNNAAWLRQETGQPGALDLARKAHDLAPDNPAVLDTLGWILAQENRERDAIQFLERAAQLAPSAPEIRYHVATTQAQLGRVDEARANLEAALSGNEPFASRAAAKALLESL